MRYFTSNDPLSNFQGENLPRWRMRNKAPSPVPSVSLADNCNRAISTSRKSLQHSIPDPFANFPQCRFVAVPFEKGSGDVILRPSKLRMFVTELRLIIWSCFVGKCVLGNHQCFFSPSELPRNIDNGNVGKGVELYQSSAVKPLSSKVR